MPVGGYKYPTTLRMKIAESSVVGDDRNMLQPELRSYLLKRGIAVYHVSHHREGQNP